ncbi:MAG TPA: cell division topological specificity factor MinE [Candidatus Baltobacteraceae bacterium]|nr:cell division topological specificity factor MinE [Candidatus Baltobacteraceae bacterium]
MIEFINKLFGRQNSGATAKERLRLVLMSDHLSLAPEMIEAMKRDIVDVISRYVEIDNSKMDVHFEHQDKSLAMLANIPITGVARNNPPGGPGNGSKADDDAQAASAEARAESAPAPQAAAPKPQGSGNGPRRKRKKSGGAQAQGTPAPAT